jgi:stage V sporulation protein R
MSDWNFKDLEMWDEKICEIAESHGLNWYPIVYETCDYYQMIGHMSYHGMPSHYGHWSFGKSFERTHQMYNLGMEGLPYELIINSNPSIAYLMLENPFYLQILIMAHCVGHSDFFKNNRMFADTRPESIVSSFRAARKRIQGYIENPNIGIKKVEHLLDALHAIQHQTYRFPKKYIPHKQRKKELINLLVTKQEQGEDVSEYDTSSVPLEPEYDILGFIIEHSRKLEEWQRDVIEIVQNESQYFMPQINTKIMNEGWACYWHYTIMHELDLPQKFHIPFLKSHNQVIRPHIGGINPYHLGFCMFQKIKERHGMEECFLAREVHHDVSFIRQYLTQEDCEDLNLFSYGLVKNDYMIKEVSDEDGWKKIKNSLISNIGSNTIPIIYVESIEEGNVLTLHHEHDGRDLELEYAERVVDHISTLWGDVVKLITIIEDEPFEI